MKSLKAKLHWRSIALGCVLMCIFQGCSPSASQNVGRIPVTLASLLAMPTNELAPVEIARVNLLCAQGLPGCETVDVTNSLAVLDHWAARVKAETKRHQYRFERTPVEFEHSKGFFKMLMLGVVLAEDFKVHYRKDRQVEPDAASIKDGFFGDARDVFLPGLLSEQRQGTCSSMPVLYVAVGRRLGYPLKLVTTKGHLFVRWEGEGERFNLEVTGNGLNRFADDYYWQWPFAVSEAEVTSECYLQSLSPADELAVFLSIRAMCLQEAAQMARAADAFDAAAKLAPEVQSYRVMAARCRGAGNDRKSLTRMTGESK
jgi:Transglutaminase-like superfamily